MKACKPISLLRRSLIKTFHVLHALIRYEDWYVTVLAKGITNLITFSLVSRLVFPETNEDVIRFVIPFAKTVTYQSSYLIRACKTWNVLISDLRNRDIGLQAFKSGLKTYYKYALSNIYKYDDPRTWNNILFHKYSVS